MGRAYRHARGDVTGADDGIAIRSLSDGDIPTVVALWRASGLLVPHNDPVADIALCRTSRHGDILIAEENGTILASIMVGHDGHRGWVYYLAVDPAHRRRGLGRQMMSAAEAWLAERRVRKLELMIRNSNHAVKGFYAALGYVEEPIVVMSRWLDGTQPNHPPPVR